MASEPVKLYRVTGRRSGPQGVCEVTDWLDDAEAASTVAGETGTVTAGTWHPDDNRAASDPSVHREPVRLHMMGVTSTEASAPVPGTWYPDDGDEAARAVAGELLAALDAVFRESRSFAPDTDAYDRAVAVLAKARGEKEERR